MVTQNWKSFDDLNALDKAWATAAQQGLKSARPMSAREEFDGPVTATIPLIFDDALPNFAKARAMEGMHFWACGKGRAHPELTDQMARMIGDQIRHKPELAWLWDVWRGKLGHHGAPQD